MLLSKLIYKTQKNLPADEVSLNAKLLIQACFIRKEAAGIYSFLPLGLKVLNNIENIIREEINIIGGQELFMNGLTPKQNWVQTDRWENFDALFKLEGKASEYALGATHEEMITPLAKQFINSYKDLPLYLYQIQTKFRNEERAKSGILRGREFRMKDLYSFHTTEEDLVSYYEKVKQSYIKIYNRIGLGEYTYPTYADGGAFSKYSEEFQTITEAGEDEIYICEDCHCAINKEIIEDQKTCPQCNKSNFTIKKAIEVGNIFKLGTKFTKAFDLNFIDQDNTKKLALMGCYGIGPSRLMGAVVEVCHDENGIVWPESIAPFKYEVISLGNNENILNKAEEIYKSLKSKGFDVLFDDRNESAGTKLKDADLIGCPNIIIIGERNLSNNKVEFKNRKENKIELKDLSEFI